jgi:hypothetical protein
MLNDRARKNLARLLADPSTPYWAVELIKAIQDSDPSDVRNTLDAIVEAIEDRDTDTDAAGRLPGAAV